MISFCLGTHYNVGIGQTQFHSNKVNECWSSDSGKELYHQYSDKRSTNKTVPCEREKENLPCQT